MISRRHLLQAFAASQLLPLTSTGTEAASQAKPDLGPPQRFNFEILKALAETKAKASYLPPPMPDPAVLKLMTYDVANSIKYDPDYALYGQGRGPYPVTFLTVGQIFLKSVAMYALEGEVAREVIFKPDYFTHPPDSPLAKLRPEPSPFAGFELRQDYSKVEQREHEGFARFVGASYFRAVGEANQFGLSARAVAQNTGGGPPEEFPDFTHFWIAEGKTAQDPVEVYALLDGPSLTGAFRFEIHRGRATVMDIKCRLHLRTPIVRLGIAPLTSMFWFSETAKGAGVDWRPEVHDSDGLAIWTRDGEHVWRPLNDPPRLDISTFEEESPRGFGLMQRDKVYDHYLDIVKYDSRPCGWVEPKGAWGKGSIQLVEIPTDNEIYDNVVAMWVPAEPTRAGQSLDYAYRLHWCDRDPYPGELALCIATRLGRGGMKGAPRSTTLRTFVIEFKGAILASLAEGQTPEPVLEATHGKFLFIEVGPAPQGGQDHWRLRFDLDPDGADVVDLRCALRFAGKALTETWRYHYIRFESPDR